MLSNTESIHHQLKRIQRLDDGKQIAAQVVQMQIKKQIRRRDENILPSLKLKQNLKFDGWKITSLLGPGLFSGAFAVRFKEGRIMQNGMGEFGVKSSYEYIGISLYLQAINDYKSPTTQTLFKTPR